MFDIPGDRQEKAQKKAPSLRSHSFWGFVSWIASFVN